MERGTKTKIQRVNVNFYCFMKQEAETNAPINLNIVLERVVQTTWILSANFK